MRGLTVVRSRQTVDALGATTPRRWGVHDQRCGKNGVLHRSATSRRRRLRFAHLPWTGRKPSPDSRHAVERLASFRARHVELLACAGGSREPSETDVASGGLRLWRWCLEKIGPEEVARQKAGLVDLVCQFGRYAPTCGNSLFGFVDRRLRNADALGETPLASTGKADRFFDEIERFGSHRIGRVDN